MPLPSQWKHHSGRVYELLDIPNITSDRPKFLAAAYFRHLDTGETFTRPIWEFIENFEPVAPH